MGCYFHHTQSIYKKINSLGLSNLYKNDEKVGSTARKLVSLTLSPIDKVKLALECLYNDHPDSLDPLFDYYESFWMGSLSLELWNVSNLIIKTNNTAEGKIFLFHSLPLLTYVSCRLAQPFRSSYRKKSIRIFGISFKFFNEKKFM